MSQTLPLATPVHLMAADGVRLGGFFWRHEPADRGRPVVVITAATSVRCRYYARFAAYLFDHGFDVLTYDYRGIGESRPASLRGFRADWVDWGRLDFEAALQWVDQHCPGQPVLVVAHSIGGFALGLAPSNTKISRIFTVGAQYAYWRDYAASHKARMLVKWHVVMPLLTQLYGYFPAKRMGWMEDTPAGVVRDWSRMRARFEQTVRGGAGADNAPLVLQFQAVTAPILAVSLTDDPHATLNGVERLLAYYTNSPRHHLSIAPHMIGQSAIGHFAFFHDRFRTNLWPVALHWLQSTVDAPVSTVGDWITTHPLRIAPI